ncbi:hypothetical protein V5799_033419, partial [Amblyomma americanum]
METGSDTVMVATSLEKLADIEEVLADKDQRALLWCGRKESSCLNFLAWKERANRHLLAGMENLRPTSLFLKVSLGLLFLVAALVTQKSFACNTPIPKNGPRLFRAKALFGDIVRDCHKELLYIFQKIHPKKLKLYLQYTCAITESCMNTIPENSTLMA